MCKNSKKPLISIIIPTYKRPDKLSRSLESVLNQTYQKFEIIIVDDNNEKDKYRQETKEFIQKYNDPRIIYIKHRKNEGGAAARNTGIRKSNGQYIAFLDDDDAWRCDSLEIRVQKLFDSSNDFGVCFSNYNIITSKGKKRNKQSIVEGNIFKKQLLKDHVSPTSAVMVKKECFDKVGLFDKNLPARQDYEMWIRISRHYKFIYVDELLVDIYRVNGNQRISTNHNNKIKGTKIVLDKIINKYQYTLGKKYMNQVVVAKYLELSKIYIKNNESKKARIYLLKSLKLNALNYNIYLYFILTFINFKIINKLKVILGNLFDS